MPDIKQGYDSLIEKLPQERPSDRQRTLIIQQLMSVFAGNLIAAQAKLDGKHRAFDSLLES
jgi:hypothetical protein